MVLAFFGRQHSEAELRTLMRTDPNGTPVRRLTELTRLGFDVDFVTTDIAGLITAPQQVSHSDFLLAWLPNACTVAIVRPRP
jgi:hypothetical protein